MGLGIRVWGIVLSLFFFQVALGAKAETQVHFAKYLEKANGQKHLLYEGLVPGNPDKVRGEFNENRYPQTVVEHKPLSGNWVVELHSKNRADIKDLLKKRRVIVPDAEYLEWEPTDDEVIALVENGPSSNRIDLVFMGDGYTKEERDLFIADMTRLTQDMFEGVTFRSYLPLLNVYAVFRPSSVSGIGKNSTPKNTAYGLYREGNTLRAIYLSKPSAARQSCRQAPGCDYPIVIGNDPYYGGLGGEFAISTSSVTSGTMVLRHELGHTIGHVGEEYDGGGYFGANYSPSLSSLKWKHWLSGELRGEKAATLFLDWPWHNLTKGPLVIPFKSSGEWASRTLEFSASGIETFDTLEIQLDDEVLPPLNSYLKDRQFHTLHWEGGFLAGAHQLSFKEMVSDGDNWISSAQLYEYGADYNFDPANIGAYPNFHESGNVAGYRATHGTCLMREMPSPVFCAICQENNWLQLFDRVSIIDGVDVVANGETVLVTLKTPPLGQFRERYAVEGESLKIRWYRNGSEVSELLDQSNWSMTKSGATGNWEVRVQFITPEVRKDPKGLLKAKKQFTI